MEIGYKIRKLREELGISQLELSEKLNFNNKYYQELS